MSAPRWHRIKIVCTLQPATDAPDVLARMVAAEMNVARVNVSHGSDTREALYRAGRVTLGLRFPSGAGKMVSGYVDNVVQSPARKRLSAPKAASPTPWHGMTRPLSR